MGKVLFLQNHLMINTPEYALPLLSKLNKMGHSIDILADSSFNKISDKSLIRTNLEKVYFDYEIKYFKDFESAKDLVKKLSPDLFLTDLTMPNSKKLVRKIHKYAKRKMKVLEMDNRATEILQYGYRNWWYKSQYSPYSGLRFSGYLKYLAPVLLNKLTFGSLGSPKKYFKPKIYSDALTLKGKWWMKEMQTYLPKKYHSRMDVTGSLRNDYIKYEALKNSDSNGLDLDQSKETILVCPLKATNFSNYYSNKKMEKYLKLIKENFDFNIVVKLHPTDIRLSKSKESVFNSKEYQVCKTEEFYPLLKKSKIILSQFSSVGLESAITETPHLYFDKYSKTGQMDMLYNQDKMKVGHGITKSNLCKTINSVLNREISFDFKNFNKHFSNDIDGKSFERISDNANKLIQ